MHIPTEFRFSNISKPLTKSFPSSLETKLFRDIEIYWNKMELSKYLYDVTATHTLFEHSVGVANTTLKLAIQYTKKRDIKKNFEIKFLTIAYFSGLFHDFGKLNCYDSYNSSHDSIRIELSLREYYLHEIANSLRHTPKLFLLDLESNKLSISQILVTYSDLFIDRLGNKQNVLKRQTKVIKSKNINSDYQYSFIKTVIKLHNDIKKSGKLWSTDKYREIL